MTILKQRPHADEFPDVRAQFEQTHPARDDQFRPAYPGVARDTLAWLRAQDAQPAPAEQIRHALAALTAPLATLLNQPTPRTDWRYLLGAVESAELAAWSRLTADFTRALDTIANVGAFARHQLHAEHDELLVALDAELVDAFAALILVEVA